MIRRLKLSGDPYAMGLQHGRQVRPMRPLLSAAIHNRLDVLEKQPCGWRAFLGDLLDYWEQHAPATLQMLHGISDALVMDWKTFLPYTVSGFLMDHCRLASPVQGCTVWAASGPATLDGAPLLVKNRDYHPDHRQLQCLVHARPQSGYSSLYLTSAGSPGVFSSGMNAAGLAVADTHVTSLDFGIGLPRYHVMLELLTFHDRVSSALDYLRSVRHFGNGTLVLADAGGDMAVFEGGHRVEGIVFPEAGWLVSTNHFVSPGLESLWQDKTTGPLAGHTLGRRRRVEAALRAAAGCIDTAWARRLMGSHGDPLESLCRHLSQNPLESTISSVIYLPAERRLLLAAGRPCRSSFPSFSIPA